MINYDFSERNWCDDDDDWYCLALNLSIIEFMQKERLSVGKTFYFLENECFEFYTGIPYGFMGTLRIFTKKEEKELFMDAFNNKYCRHIINNNSFYALFLKRIKKHILNKEEVNLLQYIVPEAYPPRYIC